MNAIIRPIIIILRNARNTTMEYDLEVDARGLMCPLPLLRLKKALQQVASGAIVKVIATDPAAHLDFGVFTQQAGHEMLELLKNAEQQIFYIKKH